MEEGILKRGKIGEGILKMGKTGGWIL